MVASSDKAYGDQEELPYREDTPLLAALSVRRLEGVHGHDRPLLRGTYELPVAVTRLANIYGGGDMNFTRMVPGSARALVAGDRPVMRSDGTPERDYLYVEDAVDAYLRIAGSLDRPSGAAGRGTRAADRGARAGGGGPW